MSPFSQFLRTLRFQRGLKQKELAEKLGYEPSYLSALERSEKGPPREDFVRRLIRDLALNPDECAALDKALAASRRQISLPATASIEEYQLIEMLRPQLGRLKLLLVRQDQLATLQTEVAREMTMTEAMVLLGLGKVRMQRILRLLFPSARRVNDNSRLPWCVPRNEVEPLLTLAADLPVVTIPEEHQVSLAHVLQFWMWSGEEVVALVESVKAGALQPVSQLADARGISRWIFDIAALRALQQRIRSGHTHWISIPDLAIRLNIKQQVAYWLIFHGYIHAEKVGAGKGRGSMVNRDELLRFQKRYVLGREIAGRLGCSPRKVMRLLQEQGIDPLRSHEGEPCRQLVYANSDAIQAFLDQYAGSAAEDFRLVREQGQPPPGGRIIETE